jgi:hypothetical protein
MIIETTTMPIELDIDSKHEQSSNIKNLCDLNTQ